MFQTEQAVIGGMFYHPEYIPLATESLTEQAFTADAHRELFKAIVVMHSTGQELDFPTLGTAVPPKVFQSFLNIEEPAIGEAIKPALKKLSQAAALRSMSDLAEQIKYSISQDLPTESLIAELARRQAGVPDSLKIYGVERLDQQGQVIIFFTKPEAKQAEKTLTGIIPLATTTNIKKLTTINWSILSGRRVVIWRGEYREAADHLYHLLNKAGAQGVRVVRPEAEQAAGFGIIQAAELGWSPSQIFDYIRKNLYDPAAEEEEPAITGEPAYYEPTDDEPLPERCDWPFQCLGFDHNTYYYLPSGSNQVVALRADQHGKSHFLTLADMNWWEASYPGKQGANWDSASNALIRFQHKQGVYDPTRLRGRGAWEDAGRSVLHLGNSMYVNGVKQPPHELQTRYIYEAAAPMEYDRPCHPLSTKEAHRFIELCDLITWERPIYARILAGFCVIAPICGAMPWRPHIHVTGSAGTGKSTVMNDIVVPVVGPAAIYLTASNTAPGIRQFAGCDARPVIADEFEAEDNAGQQRIKDILELARACSSDSNAMTLKGGSDGKAKVYKSRLSFCFSSIGVNITQAADAGRVTVLSLKPKDETRKAENEAHYERIVQAIGELMTEDYCCAFRARNVRLIPTIVKNFRTFARATALMLGARGGDQMGALLAGAYTCFSSGEISLEDAKRWVGDQDWNEYAVKEEQLDEHRCLAKILETVVRVQGLRQAYDLNVGELIHISRSMAGTHEGISAEVADATLKRCGVRVFPFEDVFCVSNTHDQVKKWLDKTPWANNWRQFLARIPGAVKREQPVRFGPGAVSKAVALPLGIIGEGE